MLKKFEMQYPIEQKLEDMNVLESIIKGDVPLSALNDETKIRLISLCKERLDFIETKKRQESIEKFNKFELSLKSSQGNYKISRELISNFNDKRALRLLF